ncbi:MAG: LptF/LptG family permease [Kiritimatiellae bacterium]|nr:LptF/LptG family permease [Kiritimatiellia bacterium]MBR1836674.1 LptF/LptG family permease [Kiritimatiellia bacterium]
MNLITRYLLRQFLGPLATCLVAFNGIFVLFDLFGHLSRFLDADLPLRLVLRYYAGLVCFYSPWFVPASFMLATLYSMWQLSRHSELTAMRASGISFHLLTLPFIAAALLASVGMLALSEWVTPELAAWSDRLKDGNFVSGDVPPRKNHVFLEPGADRSWTFAEADLSTRESAAHYPKGVEIKRDENGAHVWGVRAASADWLDGVWWLREPRLIPFDIDGEELPETAVERVALPGLVPFPEFSETPSDIYAAARDWDHLSARDMWRVMRAADADAADTGGAGAERRFDFWYRLASPWMCLVITLFSIPTGITTGRQSVFKGVAAAIGTFFGLYAVVIALTYCGQHAWVPPVLAAFLPEASFFAVGLVLYRRLT